VFLNGEIVMGRIKILNGISGQRIKLEEEKDRTSLDKAIYYRINRVRDYLGRVNINSSESRRGIS
jgi:hypothetical protein